MGGMRKGIEWFVLLVLVVRPSMDLFTNVNLVAGVNPAGLLGLLLVALGLMWFLLLERNEQRQLVSTELILITAIWLLFISLWGIIPIVVHGGERFYSLKEWIRLFTYLPLIAIVYSMAWKNEGNKVVACLLLSLIVPAVVGCYQILFHEGAMVRGVHRIQGTFVHPNPFSFYLVTMIGMTYWVWRWSNRRMLWGMVIGLEMVLLLFTFSFTGIAMLAVLMGVWVLVESQKMRRMALAFGIVFAVLFVVTPTGRQRVWEELEIENLDEIEQTGRVTNSVTWRLLNWRFLYRSWIKSPWVGYGLDSSHVINYMIDPKTGEGHDPHNDYIRFLAETGVLGLVGFLVWLAGIGIALKRAIDRALDQEIIHILFIALGLYFAWLVGSLNDNLITATAYQFSLLAVIALACGSSYRTLVEREAHDPACNGTSI